MRFHSEKFKWVLLILIEILYKIHYIPDVRFKSLHLHRLIQQLSFEISWCKCGAETFAVFY
jgi:hypothetical protein